MPEADLGSLFGGFNTPGDLIAKNIQLAQAVNSGLVTLPQENTSFFSKVGTGVEGLAGTLGDVFQGFGDSFQPISNILGQANAPKIARENRKFEQAKAQQLASLNQLRKQSSQQNLGDESATEDPLISPNMLFLGGALLVLLVVLK